MNQHELALSLYVHKLHVPELALSYCDWVYETMQLSVRSNSNIYLTLLQIYLNPRKRTKDFEKRINNIVSSQNSASPKVGSAGWGKARGRLTKKIAAIEGAEDMKISSSSAGSGRSDAEETSEEAEGGTESMEHRPSNYYPEKPNFRKSSEAYQNLSVIKSLRHSENLQVKDELYNQRKTVVKINSDSMFSLCHKKLGTSVFAIYPKGKTLVHFVCFRDSQNMKAVVKGSSPRKR
ncbi:Vacuolar sorting protein 39/Transforming growth factor beta receptor-associated domain 2 [Dillenia turbinata]|uniref:Vacuolar sorting protein 39/Transforming growth factor beta receptor-associated domain 2 n=1 Tax=Dillenia turbinata TaxID=194707 RepID=A0AAN8VBP6_9MAGN